MVYISTAVISFDGDKAKFSGGITLEWIKKINLVLELIQERIQYRTVYLIYIKLLICATIPLTYPKGYVLSIRLICVKHIIMISFLSKPSIMFHHNM